MLFYILLYFNIGAILAFCLIYIITSDQEIKDEPADFIALSVILIATILMWPYFIVNYLTFLQGEK